MITSIDEYRRYREELRQDCETADSTIDMLDDYAQRYFWMLPLLTGDDSEIANRRTVALGIALSRGLDGDAAIVAAMEAEPL